MSVTAEGLTQTEAARRHEVSATFVSRPQARYRRPTPRMTEARTPRVGSCKGQSANRALRREVCALLTAGWSDLDDGEPRDVRVVVVLGHHGHAE